MAGRCGGVRAGDLGGEGELLLEFGGERKPSSVGACCCGAGRFVLCVNDYGFD